MSNLTEYISIFPVIIRINIEISICIKYLHRNLKKVCFIFTISGHGIYNRSIAVDSTLKKAVDPHGECVIGTNYGCTLSSVHDITLELLKLDTKQITMTLDCCRTVTRDAVIELASVDLS